MRCAPAGVAVALLVTSACGRIGFDPYEEQTLVASGSDGRPFGGADATDVAVVDGRAVLARQPTFATMPTHLPRAVSAAAACAQGYDVAVGGGSGGFLSPTDCGSDLLLYEKTGGLVTFAGELVVANQGLGLVEAAGALHSVMGYCGASTDDERIVRRHVEGGAGPTIVGTFPDGAYFLATGVVLDGAGAERIVAAGGYGSGPLRDLLQAMDPATGAARHLDVALGSARCLAAGASAGSTLYVFGGSTNVDCVPPATTATPEMTDEIVAVSVSPDRADVVARLPEPLAAACAVARADGTIAIFGGLRYATDGAGGFVRVASDAVHVFDPVARAVTTHAATLPEGRAAMACARTGDDRTLLFGGARADGSPTDQILLFEPYAPIGKLYGTLDAGTPGAQWTRLTAETEISRVTAIALQVRVTDAPAGPGESTGWISVANDAPLPAGVPRGRYLEWLATLTSDSPTQTPRLRHVVAAFIVDG